MVICESCDAEVDTVAIRDCSQCKKYIPVCWPCSDGKASGKIEIKHKSCPIPKGGP